MRGIFRRFFRDVGEIRALTADDVTSDLQTRQPELADFFRTKAWRDQERNYSRTFVMPAARSADPPMLGYYTLAMNRLGKDDFPSREQSGLLYAAQPVAILQCIAREQRLDKARKVGELLMADALRRVERTSRDIGCLGVALFAMNQGLQRYYSDYGFQKLERKPTKNNPSQLMFLPMVDLRANLPDG